MAQKRLTFKEQMAGFPWSQLLFLAMVRIVEPMSFTSLFPYVYFMVRDFNIAPDQAQVSKYSGYLASTFALCQVLSAYHWGKLSQRYGRKPTLLCGLFGTAISLLTFGFAKNYYQTLVARSMMGILNGNVSIVRTAIGEIATERRHQGMAFSMLPLFFEAGVVIGPMIGGYLVYRPQDNEYPPVWFPSFLKKMIAVFPYSLPNVTLCCYITVSMCSTFLFFEETHPTYSKRKDYGIQIGDFIKKHVFRIKVKSRPWNNVLQNHDEVDDSINARATEQTPLVSSNNNHETYSNSHRTTGKNTDNSDIQEYDGDSDVSEADSIHSLPLLTRRESVSLIRTYSVHEVTDITDEDTKLAFDGCKENSAIHHVLHTKVFYPVSVNFIMSLHVIVFNEFLPIFLAYDLEKNPNDPTQLLSKFPWKITGGIGYQPEQTGTLLSLTGIFGVLVVIFVFPVIDRRYDCLTIFRSLVKVYPILYIAIPYVVFLQRDWIPSWVTVCYLYFITGSKTLCSALSSPQIMLLIHNSSPLSCRAVINGATISITATARFLGPLIWGYVMSWGQEYQIAWISWWLLGIISIVALFQSYKIDPIDEDVVPPARNRLERTSSLRSLSNKSRSQTNLV